MPLYYRCYQLARRVKNERTMRFIKVAKVIKVAKFIKVMRAIKVAETIQASRIRKGLTIDTGPVQRIQAVIETRQCEPIRRAWLRRTWLRRVWGISRL